MCSHMGQYKRVVIFLGALRLLDLEIGQGLGEAGDGGDPDAQRAPVALRQLRGSASALRSDL
jgi:hypothetical protein